MTNDIDKKEQEHLQDDIARKIIVQGGLYAIASCSKIIITDLIHRLFPCSASLQRV